MPSIRVVEFSGLVPRKGPTLLAQNQAQIAQNVKLQSGEIRAWRKPLPAFTPYQAGIKTVHKHLGAASAFQWLEWTTDVNVVTSPVVDTADYRLYYTGSGTPKKTNWALASSGVVQKPGAFLEMGVPAPTTMPALSASGGTAPTETRAYAYTYISTFGVVKEESAPSPANLVTCNASGATVTVNGFAVAPTTNYNITAIRIYRSVTGATTSSYFFVTEIPIATSTYADTLTVVQLGAILYSQYFTPPPAGLAGVITMPNGIIAGFVDNQVWFCEPYYPHAWPSTYSLTVEFPIKGLGVYNNTLVVCTSKNPFLITGNTPAAMSVEKLPITYACISKRSIVYDQFGVMYASPEGIVAIGAGVLDIITAQLFTHDEWALYYPSTIIAGLYAGRYLGFYNNGSTTTGFAFARNDQPSLTGFDYSPTGLFVESASGSLYAINSTTNKLEQLDADTTNSGAYAWKSARFVEPHPVSFAAMKVDADYAYMNDMTAYTAALAAYNAAQLAIFSGAATSLGGTINDQQFNATVLNGSNMGNAFASSLDFRSIIATVYADGVLVFSSGLTSNDPFRMPSGFKSYEWEVLFTGNVPIRGFAMSTSIGELKNISSGSR